MEKKMILLMSLSIFLLAGLATAGWLNSTKIDDNTYVSDDFETIVLNENKSGKAVSNFPTIQSNNDLLKYIESAEKRLDLTKDDESYFALVTYKTPITLEEMNQLLLDNEVKGLSAIFISLPSGGGNLPLPIDAETLNELMENEKFLKERFAENMANDPSVIGPKPEEFSLFHGVVANYIEAEGSILKKMNGENILLVDVGPIDYKDKENTMVYPGKDIYAEWIAYSVPQ